MILVKEAEGHLLQVLFFFPNKCVRRICRVLDKNKQLKSNSKSKEVNIMRCKTRREKFAEVMEDVKRFFLITVISVLGTALAAAVLCFMLTISENKQLKMENQKLRETVEAIQEEEKHNTTTYTVVVDDKTGKAIYADY